MVSNYSLKCAMNTVHKDQIKLMIMNPSPLIQHALSLSRVPAPLISARTLDNAHAKVPHRSQTCTSTSCDPTGTPSLCVRCERDTIPPHTIPYTASTLHRVYCLMCDAHFFVPDGRPALAPSNLNIVHEHIRHIVGTLQVCGVCAFECVN